MPLTSQLPSFSNIKNHSHHSPVSESPAPLLDSHSSQHNAAPHYPCPPPSPHRAHLEILKYLYLDRYLWAVMSLRTMNRYFRSITPPLTYDELVALETTEYAKLRAIHVCRYCLRLLPAWRFAQNMVEKFRTEGRTYHDHASFFSHSFTVYRQVFEASIVDKPFCLECGFAEVYSPSLAVAERYSRGTDIFVSKGVWGHWCEHHGHEEVAVGKGERWVWCLGCGDLKKDQEAGIVGVDACTGFCVISCGKGYCEKGCRAWTRRIWAEGVWEDV